MGMATRQGEDMGPYSLDTQRKRYQTLVRMSKSPDINPEFRRVYQQLADSIAWSESDYEARVVSVYTNIKDKFS